MKNLKNVGRIGNPARPALGGCQQNGILWENVSAGTTVANINWISDNEFILTISNYAYSSQRNGLQRRYVRLDPNPPLTIQNLNDFNRMNDVIRNNPVVLPNGNWQ